MDKIIFSIIIFILIIIMMWIYKKRYKQGADDFFKLILKNGYDAKVASFKIQNNHAKPGGIVFVGDSITQDFNVYEYFKGFDVYNRGIGGDTTVGLATRLNESIFDLKPRTVVLLIGTNDLALLKTTPHAIGKRIEDLIFQIKTRLKDVHIILQSVYPVDEKLDPLSVLPRKNSDIKQINTYLKQICGVTYLDMFKHLSEENSRIKTEYTVEGLHINAIGYEIITSHIKPLLLK